MYISESYRKDLSSIDTEKFTDSLAAGFAEANRIICFTKEL